MNESTSAGKRGRVLEGGSGMIRQNVWLLGAMLVLAGCRNPIGTWNMEQRDPHPAPLFEGRIAEGDSAAIHAILLENGITDVPVRRVVRSSHSDGRVRSLYLVDDKDDFAYLNSAVLHVLPPEIGELGQLESLFLANNKLDSLPSAIGGLGNLKFLSLGRNSLRTLPDAIGGLANLYLLEVVGNELETLPESVGNLRALTDLVLGENNLVKLPDSICGLSNIRWLELISNELVVLPDSIGRMTDLQKLSLSNNELTELPGSILQIKGFRRSGGSVDLFGNRLCSLPDSIADWASGTDSDWKVSQRCGQRR